MRISDMMDFLEPELLEEAMQSGEERRERRKRFRVKTAAAAAVVLFAAGVTNGPRIYTFATDILQSAIRIQAGGETEQLTSFGKGYVETNRLPWMENNGDTNYRTLEDAETALGVSILKPQISYEYVSYSGWEEPVYASCFYDRTDIHTALDVTLPETGSCRVGIYARWSMLEGMQMGTYEFLGGDNGQWEPEIEEVWKSEALDTSVVTIKETTRWEDGSGPEQESTDYTMMFLYHDIQYQISNGTREQLAEFIELLAE